MTIFFFFFYAVYLVQLRIPKHLISGGQPPEVFEQALRKIAAGTALA